MSETVLNRVIDNGLLIDTLSLPHDWLGAKVELRRISETAPRLSWNEIPRVKAKSGRTSLEILQESREECV
ncbi:hypothetical protein FACS1894163_09240 [Spirochaetia bacterium]|nr:hypothetical protein FACS1894163_09240 [Spirochaetia bacterium]